MMDDIKVTYRIHEGEWLIDMTIGGATCTMTVEESQVLGKKLYETLKEIAKIETKED